MTTRVSILSHCNLSFRYSQWFGIKGWETVSILFHSNNSSSLLGLIFSMFLSNLLVCCTPNFVIQLSKLPQSPQKYRRSSLPIISTNWSINPLVYYTCFHAKPYVDWKRIPPPPRFKFSSTWIWMPIYFFLTQVPHFLLDRSNFSLKSINNMLLVVLSWKRF